MNTSSWSELLDRISAIAGRRGWAAVASATEQLVAPAPARLLIAPARNVSIDALTGWIGAVSSTIDARHATLEELADDPLPALAAPRALAVFECGRLLEPDGLDALGRAFHRRPPDTYAIVFVGAEALADASELAMLERGLRRLVGAPPGTDLMAARCYLWSNAEAGLNEVVGQRVGIGRQVLEQWLTVPAPAADLLDGARVLYCLDLAEAMAQADADRQPSTEASALHTRRLRRAREELANTRRRIARRLDGEGSLLAHQLTASVETLEQDLLVGTATVFDRAAHEAPRDALAAYLLDAARTWQARSERLVGERAAAVTAEVQLLLDSIDWDLVNEAVGGSGAAVYPAALVNGIIGGIGEGPGGRAATLPTLQPPVLGSAGSSMRLDRIVQAALGGGAVAAVAGVLLLPAGLVSVVAGAATGASLAGGAAIFHQFSADRSELEEEARRVIRHLVDDALAAAHHQAQVVTMPLQGQLIARMQALEVDLDGAVTAARRAGAAQARDGDQTALAAIRDEVLVRLDRASRPSGDSPPTEEAT